MKIGIYSLLFFSIVYKTIPPRTETEQIVVDLVNQKSSKADLSVITPANHDAIVKILRDAATRKIDHIGTAYVDTTPAEVILTRLNDTETITRLIREYRDTYGSRHSFSVAEHFEWAGQASLIPLLAEDFSLNDGDVSSIKSDGRGNGIRVIPRSVFSGITAMRVTIASKQFSAETRAWANQRLIRGYYPFDKFREEMRLWWKQNEAAFKAGNYLAVKPMQLEPAALPPALPIPEDSKRVIPPLPAKPTPRSATPTPIPDPAPAVAEAVKPIPAINAWPLWAVLAAALAAAAGWLLLRRRGRQSK